MLKSFAYYDLIEACGLPGCPVCRLLRRDEARLLDSISYEYATDRGIQARFRASRGLCAAHGAQLAQNNNALGTAVLYEQALHEVLSMLDQTAPGGKRGLGRLFGPGSGAGLADALEPVKPCIVCETQAGTEAGYIRALCDDLRDPALLDAYKASAALCLPHFRLGLRRAPDAERAAMLVEVQRDAWARLRAELNEFMRKSDHSHADEAMGAEADSWQRVVAALSGKPL